MSAKITIYPQSVSWGGTGGGTWDKTNGGPIVAEYSYGGQLIEEGTGDALWPTFVGIIGGFAHADITLRDLTVLPTPDLTTASLTITYAQKTGTTLSTVVISDMLFISASPATQPYKAAGAITLHFAHQNLDGATKPISA